MFYFTGEPCQNGHTDKRYTNTGICYGCKREQSQRDYANHSARVKRVNDRSRKKNAEKVARTKKAWTHRNREKSNGIKKSWKERHREQHLAGARDYHARRMTNPFFKLSQRVSKSIWSFMKGAKGGRRWTDLVGYTRGELCEHLESQFTDDMEWANYGHYWHVDHIVPKVFFERLDLGVEERLRLAFALVNLRPCVGKGPGGNLSKNDKIIPELAAPVLKALGLQFGDDR